MRTAEYHRFGWAMRRLMSAENVRVTSLEELADKLTAAGYPVSRQLMSDYMKLKKNGTPRVVPPVKFIAALKRTFDLTDAQRAELLGAWLSILPAEQKEVLLEAAAAPVKAAAAPVKSVAALMAIPHAGLPTGVTRNVLGYYAPGDGGGGLFRYDASSSTRPDEGMFLTPKGNLGNGRWKRVWNGEAINVLWYGAKGDSTGDQSHPINQAISYAGTGEGGAVYIPKGAYLLTTPILPVSRVRVFGEGPGTQIYWNASGICVSLNTTHGPTQWQNMEFIGMRNGFTLFSMDNTFSHQFTSVHFRGTHESTKTARPDQYGINIIGNAGDSRFTSCAWFKLGIGVATDSIMNYISQGHFSECYYGIVGTTTRRTAGISLTNTSFASTPGFRSMSPAHIDIRGTSSDWFINNCWFEGANKSIIVGRSGVGGPSGFSIQGCHIASSNCGIEIQSCRTPRLFGLGFYDNPGSAPVPVTVNAAGSPHGSAIGITNLARGGEQLLSAYPQGWFVYLESQFRVPAQVLE
jgi:hypothetical protein